jgi:hypothetical protein
MSSEPQRSASVRRHFLLAADLVQGHSHDRHSLAKRLGVRLAMADRLMRAAAATLPGVVLSREGRRTMIHLERAALLPAPTYPTAVAACFGASVWPLFQGSSYQAGIKNALEDVIGRTRRRAVFKDIDRKFWFLRRGGEAALLDRAPLLDEVIEAVLHHRVVAIEYTRFDGKSQALRIEPYSIVVHDHQLYVIGRSERGTRRSKDDSEGRIVHPYRFSRIASVDVLSATFQYPARTEYDPARVFRDSFGIFLNRPPVDVVVRLDPRWATYARTHLWHESQTVASTKTGVEVRMRVGVCPELEAWILGFGEQAEVISPANLRDRVRERLAAASEVYPKHRRARVRTRAS